MPERIERLRETLAELEAELAELDSLDPESRARLQQVAGEIAEVLHRFDTAVQRGEPIVVPSGEVNRLSDEVERLKLEPPHTLEEQLIEQVETFRVQHPTVAGILQRLVHGLAGLGI